MENKTCPNCNTIKLTTEFYEKTSLCKVCYNEKRKHQKKIKKTSNETALMLIFKRLQISVAKYFEDSVEIDELVPIVNEFSKQVKKIIDELPSLTLKIELSDTVYTYLKSCYEHQFTSPKDIHAMMYDKSKTPIFKELYGVNRADLIECAPEVSNLFDVIIALSVAYNYFIERINHAKSEIFKNYINIPDVKARFNFDIGCIEFDTNPLKFTPTILLTRIKNETQKHYGMMYYHENGNFDQLYKTYDVK